MKLAIVIGGWHFPLNTLVAFRNLAPASADLYIVEHRAPGDAEMPEQYRQEVDGKPYRAGFANDANLVEMGYYRIVAQNDMGDWQFVNQWAALQDWRRYDAVLFSHDDQYVRGDIIGETIRRAEAEPDILLWTHGRYEGAPECYARGSYELFRRELLERFDGQLPLGDCALSRIGKTDTPVDFNALSAWNNTLVPLREYMRANKMKVGYLSEYYRVSRWMVEGERGLLSSNIGAPWSFNEGLKAWPL